MAKPKVFGIGFQKTGTTTLGVIFDRLGYRTAGYHQFRNLAARESVTMEEIEAQALGIAADHDAAKDTPDDLFDMAARFFDKHLKTTAEDAEAERP